MKRKHSKSFCQGGTLGSTLSNCTPNYNITLKNTLMGTEKSIGRKKDTGNIVLRKFSYVLVQSVQVLYAIVLLYIATLVLSTFLILIHINHSIRIQKGR